MTVKFGIIGCGSICRHRHAPELAANPQAEILAFCDIVPERADAMVELYGGKAYTDWKDVVADPKIDAIVVCLPNYLHAPVIHCSPEGRQTRIVRKPMATSAEEAEEMIQAAKDSGKYLMIGHNQRLMPPHVKAKEILDSGKLGKVLTFRTTFGHAGPEGWCVDKSVKTWFFQKDKAFIGAMGDLGVHKADLIR